VTDFESRIGVDPIDRLLAEREQLVRFAADLYAKWGPFGSGEARRKSALALAHLQVRNDLGAEKATEAKVDAMARTHPTYLSFLDAMEDGRARWLMAENDIQSITDRIHRGQSLVRAYASEPR
jgi:hypothetical protein